MPGDCQFKVDVNGMFTTWKNVVARDSAPKPAKAEPPALKSLFDDEVKESTKTTDSKGSKGVRGLDSDGDDESEEEDDGSPAGVMSDEDGVGDGFVVDDDGAGYAEYGIDIPRKESAMRPGFQRHRFGESGDFGGSSGTFMTSCQKAFQPGSTPMKPGRTTRYLGGSGTLASALGYKI